MKHTVQTLVLLLSATPALGQEGGGIPQPDMAQDLAGGAQELQRLFLEVEAELARIDRQLYDAGAGEVALEEVEDAGLDDLLKVTLAGSNEVQSKIDRILEIARQMGSPSSGGGGGGEQQSQGESPLDQERDTGPQGRENTPEGPQQQPGEEEGEEPGQEHEDQQPGDGEEPRGDQQDEPGGENQSGDPPRPESGDAIPHGEEADAWGSLPVRQREIFRNQGRDDLPVQYRDWIDAYYRRLSASDR